MYDTIIHIHAQPKRGPNQIMLCDILILWYLALPNPCPNHLFLDLVLAMVSIKAEDKQSYFNIKEERSNSQLHTNASKWSFGDTNIRPFKHNAVGTLTSKSLKTDFSPFDFTSTRMRSSVALFNCNLSEAQAFIVLAGVDIGKRRVQYV